ncbi:MAG: DUF1949 domain-containing protein [Ruminococcaceae bacterium]|nr:DUF1949 domain-containing protein [Oscillospiraceae bacterium]
MKRITLEKAASAELTERKSVFIGYASPVGSEEEAIEFIKAIKKKHADARHNVYAYMLNGGGIARYSDDGEPQGTAGVPVLDIIRKGGFCDAVIVVTRYFGGILLGAGGLVRAYSAAARMAVEAAGIVTYDLFTEFSLTVSYNDHGKLTNLLAQANPLRDGIDYADGVTLRLALPGEELEDFRGKASEITAGRAVFEVTGERFDKR